jgi:hypothetical protein
LPTNLPEASPLCEKLHPSIIARTDGSDSQDEEVRSMRGSTQENVLWPTGSGIVLWLYWWQ